jgi:hypothetical protein
VAKDSDVTFAGTAVDQPNGMRVLANKFRKTLIVISNTSASTRVVTVRKATNAQDIPAADYSSIAIPVTTGIQVLGRSALATPRRMGPCGLTSWPVTLAQFTPSNFRRKGGSMADISVVKPPPAPQLIASGTVFVKNSGGAIHDIEATHAAAELAKKGDGGWRLASTEEIAAYCERHNLIAPEAGAEIAADEPDATPAAVEAAKATGVDLSAVKGTGQGGTITKADVEAAAKKG